MELKEGYIPRVVWMYQEDSSEIKPDVQEYLSSNKQHFIGKSGFALVTTSSSNYSAHLKKSTYSLVQSTLRRAQERWKLSETAANKWEKTLILLAHLYDNGGVMLYDDDLLLTEPLSWLPRIDTNPYTNRGHQSKPAEVIGFYEPKYRESQL